MLKTETKDLLKFNAEGVSPYDMWTSAKSACLLAVDEFVEKHGEPLFRMIDESAKGLWGIGTRKVFFVSGKTPADTREEIRSITEKEKEK